MSSGLESGPQEAAEAPSRTESRLSQLEQRVLDSIDLESLLKSLGELVAIRSLGGRPEESEAQLYMADLMKRCGLETDLWELDFAVLGRHPAYCVEVERERGLGLVGWLGHGRNGRSLILNGHVDVVPVGDESQWVHPPWSATFEDGKAFGRGALDMKGALLCALYAAQAIKRAEVGLKGRLLIQSVIGEEDGGVGTLSAVLRGYRADGAIVLEPTGLAIAPAQAGAANFRITVPGRAAHGCAREEGVSAIEKFLPLHSALLDLERQRNQQVADPLFAGYALPYAISVGTLRAGEWASTVPDSLVCEGRYGLIVGEDTSAARRRLEAAIERAADRDEWLREHRPRVEWCGGQFEPAGIPTGHPLVESLIESFSDAAGARPRLEGVRYGSDMRHLVHEGEMPAVLFGPGDIRNAHRPDEWVSIEDLEKCVRTVALMALRYCS